MKKASNRKSSTRNRKRSARRRRRDDIRAEYDFVGGVRGKYAQRYAEGTNVVLLEPDVAAEFPNARSVNRALRAVLKERSHRRTA
jgi:hypothetical protein